ncbi:MAG: hypothetical protein FWD17_09380, partial [Polyangiaceae bacterium]|nr:hypothetical protein [Polyangiaceae bacterium]
MPNKFLVPSLGSRHSSRPARSVALAAASILGCSIALAPASARADDVRPDGKGIAGGALLSL